MSSTATRSGEALAFVRRCLASGDVYWTYHVNMRFAQRGLTTDDVRNAADTFEIIESYPVERVLPSLLLLGWNGPFATEGTMKCTTCGAPMTAHVTDLPFKLGDTSIVVVRGVPVLQCSACPEYLIADADMRRIEVLLGAHQRDAELEVVRFAA